MSAVRRIVTVTLLALLVSLLLVPLARPGQAATAEYAEQLMLEKINSARAANGKAPLTKTLQLVRVARHWSEGMANYAGLAHNPNADKQVVGPWKRLGENVGYSTNSGGVSTATLVNRLHQAYMNSPGHRANILGDYNQMGVGTIIAPNGTMWNTVNFVKGPIGKFPLFPDSDGLPHEPNIEKLWVRDITAGCKWDRYCPHAGVTRAQMATFLVRALDLPKASKNYFSDTAGSIHRPDINALAAAGITGGCGGGRFCPHRTVSRAEMATFLVKGMDLPPASGHPFSDVGNSPHRHHIAALAAADVTAGCGGGKYCPHAKVTRAQMATFVILALDAG